MNLRLLLLDIWLTSCKLKVLNCISSPWAFCPSRESPASPWCMSGGEGRRRRGERERGGGGSQSQRKGGRKVGSARTHAMLAFHSPRVRPSEGFPGGWAWIGMSNSILHSLCIYTQRGKFLSKRLRESWVPSPLAVRHGCFTTSCKECAHQSIEQGGSVIQKY